MTESLVEVLGIRHHGPGSARSVAAALEELQPDLVLIEGAPELDALVAFAADPELVPPVAGLVYAVDAPRRSLFYPLAVFSPEWVALQWAIRNGVDARFADLPAAHLLAEAADEAADAATNPPRRPDPIAILAATAGYDDAERWWEDAVEHRRSSTLQRFAVLREAMAQLRAEGEPDRENELREAAMRRVIRTAQKAGAERIAFVCGAFHAPAVHPSTWPPASADNKLLAGLSKAKVSATWAPWTAGRLAAASGYGAGVASPGWYQHLFVTPDETVVASWLVKVAHALRSERLDASPAAVVEAVRLAEALAAVRGRPSVGIDELQDASRAVLCDGSDLPLQMIGRALLVGEELGRVPASTPMVPLASDLVRHQKSLRLKPTASQTVIQIDLRKEAQLARSVLLHRLLLLGIEWGHQVDAGRSTGTFKEAWQLEWQPELAVAVIEASVHGNTVISAAESRVTERAEVAEDLTALASLIEQCLLAELPGGLASVVHTLAERTARQHDALGLLTTIEPLARTCRYGDVRGADTDEVHHVLRTVVVRAALGLAGACSALDDDGAEALRGAIEGAHRGITLLDDPELTTPWLRALHGIAPVDSVHGSVSGRVNRMLLDGAQLTAEEAGSRLSRRLSHGADAPAAAAWLDGFLSGEALLLLHDEALLRIIDDWVAGINETTFEDLLPLLRRTFSRFEPPERRQIGEHLRHRGAASRESASSAALDLDQAAPAVARVAALLGLEASR
ncbi:DUF5682 family protein [Nocardioides sp.]|uniref:DUF5682 family protein n=1 Tax=Nocardioides sp. TaxID=35761 RepID=UPI002D7EDD15|nr:DUF5682 family protein [Nocardioides sp.]